MSSTNIDVGVFDQHINDMVEVNNHINYLHIIARYSHITHRQMDILAYSH